MATHQGTKRLIKMMQLYYPNNSGDMPRELFNAWLTAMEPFTDEQLMDVFPYWNSQPAQCPEFPPNPPQFILHLREARNIKRRRGSGPQLGSSDRVELGLVKKEPA